PDAAIPTPATTVTKWPSTSGSPSGWEALPTDEPSPAEAEESLRKFREETIVGFPAHIKILGAKEVLLTTKRQLFFPFHYIPPHFSSHQLKDTHPFLWLNIMSVTSRSNKRRLALGDKIREIIFQRIVVEREKNLDLLLGLIATLGWSHLQRRDKFYNSLFSQLIVLMIYDLGLNIPPTEAPPKEYCSPGSHTHSEGGRRERTNDERRAVLGAFLITSMASYATKGPEGVRWSMILDEYANLLVQTDVDQDRSLVALIRMQSIINQIQSVNLVGSNPNQELRELYTSTLRSQLQAIIGSENVGPVASIHPAVLEHYHFTELLILESSLCSSSHQSTDPDLKRFEVYQEQLNSVRAWLSTFYTTDVRLYGDMALFSYSELVRVMVSLHKLNTLDDTAWSRSSVRQTLDLIPSLDKLIAVFEQLRAASVLWSPTCGTGEDEAFTWAINVFQGMRKAWKDEMTGLEDFGSGNLGVVPNSLPAMPMYGATEAWWLDVFNV
ncbi:zn 2cys6 transcription factor, partial [Colletotrichum kahawae]